MTAPFSIRSITLYPAPRPAGAHEILASFTVEVGPFLIPDVALLRTATGRMQVGLPRTSHGSRLGFRSAADAQELLQLVADACRQIAVPREAPAA